MFHSFGTVQSNTCVPEGISRISSGICRCKIRSVPRTPFPVMLRQIGYSSSIRRNISSPDAIEPTAFCTGATAFNSSSRHKIRIISVALVHDPFALRPCNPKCRIVPPHTSRVLRRVRPRHLVENFRVVLQRLKSVCELLGYVQHFSIHRGEFDGEGLFECPRRLP